MIGRFVEIAEDGRHFGKSREPAPRNHDRFALF